MRSKVYKLNNFHPSPVVLNTSRVTLYSTNATAY